MRKYHQQQIAEMLRTLGEAHDEIKKAIASGQIEAVMQLLSDCQNAAVNIGNFIEQINGEGTKTVTLLEEYCELLYETGVAASAESGGNAANPIKRLQKQIVVIENSVQDELAPSRIEIVFLPYNISMWDSFETIWLAAKADPQCDALVVPIPYFELNPDGSLGLMHCDADEYPSNIPVTSWRDYDIEARRPDIVFTHYPYDNDVSNATIHPDFYSERLSRYCELLVHVPYFVTVGGVVDDYCARLPGVLYADCVIVESEDARQSYIGHYKKYDKKLGWKGRFGKAEDKFIALGSPKYDKVINSKREDFTLPDKWARLIHKPDGTAKKIVLYNTHMFAWIGGGEQYFTKIRSVFETFRDRDDILLWWRPHPNTEINFRTKRPQLLGEYYSVIREYKEGGFGIYDDTADLHRAIAWTDAYYGDASSLVAMYQLTGKPIIVQNTDVSVAYWYDTLLFEYLLYYDGYYWFTSYNFNGLFRFKDNPAESEFMGRIPNEDVEDVRLYRNITGHRGKLYFAPGSADEIAVYDISNRRFRKIPLDNELSTNNPKYVKRNKFREVLIVDDAVFFVGLSYPAIIRYNVENDALEYFTELYTEIQNQFEAFDGLFFANAIRKENSILLPYLNSYSLVDFNTEDGTYKVNTIDAMASGIKTVCLDGDNVYLIPRFHDNLLKLDKDLGEIDVFDKFPANFIPAVRNFSFTYFANGCLWLLPERSNMALRVDIHSGAISEVESFTAFMSENESVDSTFCGTMGDDGVLRICSPFKNELLMLDTETESVTSHRVEMDSTAKEHYKSNGNKHKSPLSYHLDWHTQNKQIGESFTARESSEITTGDFLDELASGKYSPHIDGFVKDNRFGTIGQRIYTDVVKRIGVG
jgi:hypothetical protein